MAVLYRNTGSPLGQQYSQFQVGGMGQAVYSPLASYASGLSTVAATNGEPMNTPYAAAQFGGGLYDGNGAYGGSRTVAHGYGTSGNQYVADSNSTYVVGRSGSNTLSYSPVSGRPQSYASSGLSFIDQAMAVGYQSAAKYASFNGGSLSGFTTNPGSFSNSWDGPFLNTRTNYLGQQERLAPSDTRSTAYMYKDLVPSAYNAYANGQINGSQLFRSGLQEAVGNDRDRLLTNNLNLPNPKIVSYSFNSRGGGSIRGTGISW